MPSATRLAARGGVPVMISPWKTGGFSMRAWLAALLLLLSIVAPVAGQVPTPDAHFGFRMGADRQLADAAAIETLPLPSPKTGRETTAALYPPVVQW